MNQFFLLLSLNLRQVLIDEKGGTGQASQDAKKITLLMHSTFLTLHSDHGSRLF